MIAGFANNMPEPTFTFTQKSRTESPRSALEQLLGALWSVVWCIFCRWTPKPFNKWRIVWLKLFGAHIADKCFVHQRANITIPWNLTMHEGACIGDSATIYNYATVELGVLSVVAQECYLCTASHNFDLAEFPLTTANITVGAHAFLGARAFVLPGVIIGEGAVLGACSVATKDIQPWTVNVGNPCKQITSRKKL